MKAWFLALAASTLPAPDGARSLTVLESSGATLTLSSADKALFELKCQDGSVIARPLFQPVLGKIITPKNGALLYTPETDRLSLRPPAQAPDSAAFAFSCQGNALSVSPGNAPTQWLLKPAD